MQKEQKETLLREKQLLYRRLAEAEKTPFYLSPHQGIVPFLPFNGSISPIYSLLSHQPQRSPPRLPTTGSPSSILTGGSTPVASLTTTTNLTTPSSSQNSIYDSTTNSLGISGLPTPGGSSVGSASTPSFPMQFYPATLMKYPFSPPTPSSLGLSPFSAANGYGEGNDSTDSDNGAGDGNRSGVKSHDTSARRGNTSSQKDECVISNDSPDMDVGTSNERVSTTTNGNEQTRSNPKNGSSNIPIAPYTWQTATNGLQTSTHIMSPLNCLHPSPLSPMMFIHSPYTSSVSSCLSVSSSSGCSSASEGVNTSADGSQIQNNSYAPSEYHVGPRRPLSERLADEIDNQSEGASNSGRNTPIDVRSDDSEENVTLAPHGMHYYSLCDNVMSHSM